MNTLPPSNPQVFPLTQEIELAGRKTVHTTGGLTLRERAS